MAILCKIKKQIIYFQPSAVAQGVHHRSTRGGGGGRRVREGKTETPNLHVCCRGTLQIPNSFLQYTSLSLRLVPHWSAAFVCRHYHHPGISITFISRAMQASPLGLHVGVPLTHSGPLQLSSALEGDSKTPSCILGSKARAMWLKLLGSF